MIRVLGRIEFAKDCQITLRFATANGEKSLGLRDLPNLQPLYILPEDDVVNSALIPSFKAATHYMGMIGFFHSRALRELAPGLAVFLGNPVGEMRLIISPYLSPEDQEALSKGVTTPVEVLLMRLENLYGSARVDESALVQHTLECLAYLIAAKRIQIKVVMVENGLFHPKVWIFSDDHDYLVVHGSSNATASGLTWNVEQLSVSRSWLGGEQEEVVQRFLREFASIWNERKTGRLHVYDLPQAIEARIVRDYRPSRMPMPQDFWDAWNHDAESGLVSAAGTGDVQREAERTKDPVFEIPAGLEYQTGDFAHQGDAVEAWEAAGRRGILEMATGSGKTVTALIGARRLLEDADRLLIVIAVPYLPLVAQWADEVRTFGLEPSVPGLRSSKSQKIQEVRRLVRNLKLGVSKIECSVVTHDFLCDRAFQAEVSRLNMASLLVADEVHNLGTPSFLRSPPDVFQYRLGLSATPIRQYDENGTEQLQDYFGEIVFRFTLEEAIGKCLVPYDYFVHPVTLTRDELDEWLEVTAKLRAMGWQGSDESDVPESRLPPGLQRLLNRRRRVLEQAEEKIPALRDILGRTESSRVRHTLVYCSDKGREQLRRVNRMLMHDLKLRIHQITQNESGSPNLTRELLDSFARASGIQVLTAMRVLDEGVDIPEVATAYILASTTVERQWIQRRGRVLRKCERTGKAFAQIHDFIVLPPEVGPGAVDISRILKSELSRIMAFAKIARNAASPLGAFSTIRPIIERYF